MENNWALLQKYLIVSNTDELILLPVGNYVLLHDVCTKHFFFIKE